ncbi:hypothetical protein Bca4012_100482 [Brassica carinata]|uniref:(rape) hypothetical protein n=1 Tax=Brassica napus TaxID=3708 RepID=A0A816QJT9_BRANA|nr:unnamed protein product [Brassica napus]
MPHPFSMSLNLTLKIYKQSSVVAQMKRKIEMLVYLDHCMEDLAELASSCLKMVQQKISSNLIEFSQRSIHRRCLSPRLERRLWRRSELKSANLGNNVCVKRVRESSAGD